MHIGFRTRTTYAPAYRTSQRSSGGVYFTESGEGILHQTCSGTTQGFTTPVVERKRADGSPLYFVQSEKFQDRYYGIYQQNGAWVFSGDDKLASQYIAKVEAFQQAQQPAEAVEVAEESGFIAPILNGPWHGVVVSISDAKMARIRQLVRNERLSAMTEAERVAFAKKEAFEKVRIQVYEIERKYAAARGRAAKLALAS